MDDNCHVYFNDGYRKKVKLATVEKMPADYEGDRLPPPAPLPKPQAESFAANPTNHNAFICDVCSKGFRKER